MFDFEDFIGILTIILAIIGILVLIVIAIMKYPDYEARNIEWNNKVNNCVLDINYRNDCKLILYKENQIKLNNNNNNNNNSGMVTGLALGLALGKR